MVDMSKRPAIIEVVFTPAFTKLQRSILGSSVWLYDNETRIVWITMLALCDKDGIVRLSPGMVAHMARVSEDGAAKALERLQEPDSISRNSEFEGRRIRRVDGGFEVLNYMRYYHEGIRQDRKDYFREKKAESRARIRSEGKIIRPEHRDDGGQKA